MLLADECWLVAHDDTNGTSLLPPRLAGIAAAAGLICEMIHGNRITATGRHLALRNLTPSPDPLQHTIVDNLVRENHTIDTWLQYFGRTAEEDIATRLIRQGALEEQQGRGLFGRKKRTYVPKTTRNAAWPTARIANRLSQTRPVDAVDQILISWIDAVGLNAHVLWDDPHNTGARYLHYVTTNLPAQYRAVLETTRYLFAQIIMTNQT